MTDTQLSSDSNRLLQEIISRRGLAETELQAGLDTLPDEALLANIDLVTERIRKALFANEPLVIFGHDDPDGLTSTFILYQFFNSCGYQKHNYFIPNRNLESHGVQQSLVDFVREGGYSLVITVDNGIASLDGVEKLNQLGCDVIITDHHLIQPEQLPQAYAILNPQLPECRYPYKSLAGAGVVLMLIRHLGKVLEHPIPPASYFWAAVGSIADKVPMTGLNRIIVRHVFEHWDEMQDASVEFLLRNNHRVSSYTDIFIFLQNTARLIANGREVGGQHTAMRFLLQVGDAKATLFQDMETQKRKWDSELNHIFRFLDTVAAGFEGNSFVYFDDDGVIPYSLLGTAATYILNKLAVPTIILKLHNEHIVCEGRCGEGFNMVEAFRFCKEHLKQYGGHVKAAGFTLEPAHYDAFLECYSEYISSTLSGETPSADPVLDATAEYSDLNAQNWQALEVLLPFGQQNPEPVISIPGVRIDDLQKHFTIEYGGVSIAAGKTGDAIVNWKGPQTIRIIRFL